jgi:hypothetical protein
LALGVSKQKNDNNKDNPRYFLPVYLAKPIRFNTPQPTAAKNRHSSEVLIITRNLPIFAASPEEAVQAHL